MKNNEQELFDKFFNSFMIKIKEYLDINLEKDISSDGINDKIFNKINNDDSTSSIEKILLQLIVDINPKNKSNVTEVNKLLLLKILDYMISMKKNGTPKPVEVYNIFVEIFSQIPLKKYFFDSVKVEGNEELYLKLIIPIIVNKNIQRMIQVLSNEKLFPKEIIKSIQNKFEDLDLTNYKSYIFLTEILQIIIKRTSENIIEEIEKTLKDHLDNDKNDFLHCKICFNFPQLFIDKEKNKLNINYPCEHVNSTDILNPANIINYKIKCSCCDENLLFFYKNFLCSKCKKIICKKCTLIHFNECLPLFFLPLSDVGLKCVEHNRNYALFCDKCELNMCDLCKNEHYHYSSYNSKIMNEEDLIKISNIIDGDKSNNKIILEFIKKIIFDSGYLRNLQFQHFFDNLLNKTSVPNDRLFKEFGDEEFNNYYSLLIEKATRGSTYYTKQYNKILNYYKNNERKINIHPLNIYSVIEHTSKVSETYSKNSGKYSALIQYLDNKDNLINELNSQKMLLDMDIIKINQVKLEIKQNSLIRINNKYKDQTVKLINRCIADNILRYLIGKYPNHFQKIILNLKIFSDIIEEYKGEENSIIKKIKEKHQDIIKKFQKFMKVNNNEEEEEEETVDSIDQNNPLIFENSIKLNNNEEISTDELNNILSYLFYKKYEGNYSAHPNKSNNKIPLSLYEDTSSKSDSDIDINGFLKKLKKSLLDWEFKEKVKFENLSECLFDGKYDKIIQKLDTKDFSEFNESKAADNLNETLINEFIKIDKLLASFKSIGSTLGDSAHKESNLNLELKNFLENLRKSFNTEEYSRKILLKIFNYEFNNCSIGERHEFISKCFDHIIADILKKHDNIINDFKKKIEKIKKNRINKKNMLEIFENLNQKTADICDDEKDKANSESNEFIDFLNMEKQDNQKIDCSQADSTIFSIRKNLGKLLANCDINWINYNKQKLTTLLFIKQNNYD